MIIERKACECLNPLLVELKDLFNSTACGHCLEIISYEKPEKKKFYKVKHLQPTLDDFIAVLNLIRPDKNVVC